MDWVKTSSALLDSLRQLILLPVAAGIAAWVFTTNLSPTPQMRLDDDLLDTYDYIIVGAGSSGSVVANRLSAQTNTTVLLIEAGGLENYRTEIPGYSSLSLFQSLRQKTEYEENACNMFTAHRCPVLIGEVFGGGSTINGLIYTRGNKQDYDMWDRWLGGSGLWRWEKVFPYFIRSEDNQDDHMARNGYHSVKGYFPVERARFRTTLGHTMLDAVREKGLRVGDFNQGTNQATFDHTHFNTKKGVRYSTAKAYLRDPGVTSRTNLHVMLGTRVTKVILDQRNRAIAVAVSRPGIDGLIFINREVILCGGAIMTPHLLMLSGIGDCDHLTEVGVPCRVHNPRVGQNLMDHWGNAAIHFIVEEELTVKTGYKNLLLDNHVGQWAWKGKGPLSIPGGSDAVGFLNIRTNEKDDWPDTQVIFNRFDKLDLLGLGMKPQTWLRFFSPFSHLQSFSVTPVLLRPKSRGFVRLRNNDWSSSPLISPYYMSHEDDAKFFAEASRKVMDLVLNSTSFRELGVKPWPVPWPECRKHHNNNTDDYHICTARHGGFTLFDYAGTCAMGSCVDDRLRVMGTQGLRVVDASVMPEIVSGNIMAACIMIGEKGADIIQGEKWFQDKGIYLTPGNVFPTSIRQSPLTSASKPDAGKPPQGQGYQRNTSKPLLIDQLQPCSQQKS